METIRHYIDLIEEAEDLYVYHGGTFSGGKYDPAKVGEPGKLRPLGKGIYAGESPAHAQRYLKYAGPNGTVKKFRVSPSAKLYPWGHYSWKELSTADQEWWSNKSDEVQSAFEKAGKVRFRQHDKTYAPWQDVVSGMSGFWTDDVRKLLISVGIDGAKQVLQGGMIEYVFYNTSVLTLV